MEEVTAELEEKEILFEEFINSKMRYFSIKFSYLKRLLSSQKFTELENWFKESFKEALGFGEYDLTIKFKRKLFNVLSYFKLSVSGTDYNLEVNPNTSITKYLYNTTCSNLESLISMGDSDIEKAWKRVNEESCTIKPPLGIKPSYIWLEERIDELNKAINRTVEHIRLKKENENCERERKNIEKWFQELQLRMNQLIEEKKVNGYT